VALDINVVLPAPVTPNTAISSSSPDTPAMVGNEKLLTAKVTIAQVTRVPSFDRVGLRLGHSI
jgi:hypothetical protein